MSKPIYQSKTFWVNVVGLIILVLQYFGAVNWVPQADLAGLLGVLNIILRFFTTTAVTLT